MFVLDSVSARRRRCPGASRASASAFGLGVPFDFQLALLTSLTTHPELLRLGLRNLRPVTLLSTTHFPLGALLPFTPSSSLESRIHLTHIRARSELNHNAALPQQPVAVVDAK